MFICKTIQYLATFLNTWQFHRRSYIQELIILFLFVKLFNTWQRFSILRIFDNSCEEKTKLIAI